MEDSIRFPHLNLILEHVGKEVDIFGFKVAYYGIIITIGILVGLILVCREAKRTGQNPEDYIDLALWSMVSGIIGARIYYVIFSWDTYKDRPLSVFNIREGGLAIYGGIIAATIVVFVFAKVKKLSFYKLADTASIGLVTGQIIGRWGNFFNREAFGGYTDSLLAMQLPVPAVSKSDITVELANHIQVVKGMEFIQVHPTFLYESLWNIGVLSFMMWYRKRERKFDGELILIYLLGYGLGRAWIEGLRTDQLLLPFIHLPVSQLLAIILVIVSAILIITSRKKCRTE